MTAHNSHPMTIAVCHQHVSAGSSADEQDVLMQLSAVREALHSLGYASTTYSCSLNLESLAEQLSATRPEVVFNLVESLGDRGELIAAVPGLLETLSLPYTGASASALYLSSNKLLARDRLLACKLPVARAPSDGGAERYIVKSVWEHASRGLDSESVVLAADASGEIERREREFGGRFFAEEFIDGREFNVALLAGPSGPEVLAIAEIAFSGFPAGEPRIVDYAAKWETDSPQYIGTQRVFLDEHAEPGLAAALRKLTLKCWDSFTLGGYARVDFRVDGDRAIILEVNANPCLAPDAGFCAALQRTGLSFETAIERIIAACVRR